MISYDNYKNRIEKLAKAKRIAHKFRFLIAGALTVVIGVSVGLMLAKGTYMSATTMTAQSVYFNEEYEVVAAKAFLDSARSQKIEYSVADSGEWSTEKPVKAGKYLARTVSPKLIGYSYSKTVSFEILPLDATFEITGESVVYGDVPVSTTTGLVAGHRIDTDVLEFNYSDPNASSTFVDVNQSSVRIIDANGEDYTTCYNVSYTGKQLNVLNRELSVKPADMKVTYDGTAQHYTQSVENCSIVGLAKGDEVIFETAINLNGAHINAVTDAGDYVVDVTGVTVMHGSTNVTSRYNITEVSALLAIDRRALTLTTASEKREYDGTALCNPNLADGSLESSNIVEGHRIIAESAPSITNVGWIDNAFTVKILDDSNCDVTYNYQTPTFTYGRLEVIQRSATIITGTETKTYDGIALENSEITFTGGVTSHRALSLNTVSIIEAGSISNKLECAIYDAFDEDVTANYALTYEYGTLKIDKRKITVTTGSAARVFNGNELSNDTAEVTSGSLVTGQQLVVNKLFAVTNVTAADGADNTTTYNVVDVYDNTVTGNYEISYVYGKLTVNVRRIVVYTDDGGRIYDGTPYSKSSYRTVWEEDENEVGLITGELTVVSTAEITHFGTIDNECEYSLADGNYAIAKVVPGTLEITARPIVVVTKSDSKVYDGTALSAPEYIHTYLATDSGEAGLIGEDKLTLVENSAPSITNFGATNNTVLFDVPSTDYEIKDYDVGIISILQRHIIVTTATDEKEYDGDPLENTDYETAWADDTTKVGLIGNDELINFSATKVTQVGGPVANACDYYLPLFDGVHSNYVIDVDGYVYGTLTITPRPIMVVTESDSKAYDGTPLSKTEGYSVYYAQQIDGVWTAVTDGSVAGLIGDDELTLTYTAEITDFGTADNACAYKHENIYGRSNYDIHYTYGTLEITVRKIIVVTSSDSKVYDGQPLTAATYDYTYIDGDPAQPGLLGDDKLILVAGSAPSITNYGSVKNTVLFTVPNTNYEIVYHDEGTLEITKRHITVTTDTDEKVYDGIALSNAGYKTALSSDPEKAGLIGSDKLTVTGNPSITDVGEIENKAESYTLPLFDGVNSNYVIDVDGYDYGTLTVTVRTLSITTGSASKEYDGTPLTQTTVAKCVYIDKNSDEFTGLVLDHKLRVIDATITSQTAATGADGVDNTTEYEVVDGNGNPINNNYEIKYVAYGKLVITRATLTVISYVYGGSSNYDRPALTYGDNFEYEKGIGNYRSATALVNGEKLEISVLVYEDGSLTTPITPKNAGTYYLAIDTANCIVYDKDNNVIENGINNYSVSPASCGLLHILPKEIIVVIDSQNCVYGEDIPGNDFKIYEADGTTVIVNGSLPHNETLSLTYAYSQDENEVDKPKNAGDYQISATAAINGDTAGTDNYEINIVEGTLTIEQYEIEIQNIIEESLPYGIIPYTVYSLKSDEPDEQVVLPYNEYFHILVEYSRDGKVYVVGEDKFNAGAYDVKPVEFRAFNANDSQASIDNYKITCDVTGIFNVTPKKLTIKIDDREITYGDELPKFTYDVYEYDFDGNEMLCEALPYEDDLAVSFKYYDVDGNEVETPKNAGVYTIAFDSALINLSEDELNNYDIGSEDGTLTIKPKAISLYVDRKTEVYGNELPENTYILRGQLVEGDTITLVEYRYEENTENGKVYNITPKNVGTYYISIITVKINGVEIPVSYVGDEYYNYAIAVNNAELKITPRDITVVLSPVGNVLYGATFEYADSKGNYASLTNIAYDEQLKVAVKYYDKDGKEIDPKNAGTYSAQIDLEGCVFYDKDGEVIEGGLSNYSVTCDALENLEIGKRALIIKPLSFTSENGNAVIYGYTFTYPAEIGNHDTVYIDGVDTENIPYGEQFKVTLVTFAQNGTACTPKNVGMYEIYTDMSGVLVYDEDGNLIANGLDNYDITKDAVGGDFEIVARDITVELKDILKVVYGNSYAYPDEIGNYKAVYTTAYGEQLKFTVKFTDEDENDVDDPTNAGIYNIVPVSFTVYDSYDKVIAGGENNYNLTGYTAGTLEIVPLEIGVRFEYPEITYGEDIPTELKLEGLYTVSYAVGGIGLSPIDGLPYGDTITFDFEYGLLEDDKSSSGWFGDPGYGIFNPVTPRNAGTYVMVITNVYINGGDYSNYRILIDTPCLTVWERDITFELNAISNETYGESFTYADAKGNYIGTPDLAYDEQLKVAVKYYDKDGNEVEPKNAGIYSAKIDLANCVVYDKDGKIIEGGIDNYNVSCASLENLEILQKKLYIVIDNQGQNGEIIYGDELPANTFKIYDSVLNGTEIVNGELPYDEIIDFVFEYRINSDVVTPKNAGDYTIWFDYTKPENIIINGVPYGSDDEKNYLFAVSAGKLTISKKTLDITLTDDFTLIYGDTSHTTAEYINDLLSNPYFATVEGEDISLAYGEKLCIAVKYYDKDGKEVTPKNVDDYTIRAYSFDIKAKDNAVIESGFEEFTNYIINCGDGLLTINPKPITVTVDDQECYYGEALPQITSAITSGLDENGELPYNEYLEIYCIYENDYGEMLQKPDVGEYTIAYKNIFINLGTAGTENYTVTEINGTLTVKQRDIRVTVSDLSPTYGDEIGKFDVKTELLDRNGDVIEGELPYDEELSLTFKYTLGGIPVTNPQNVGKYAIEIDTIDVTGGNGNSGNYNFIRVGGNLTINSMRVQVTIEGASCEYGEDVPHSKFTLYDSKGAEIEKGGLPYGESIDFVYRYIKGEISTLTPTAADVYSIEVESVVVSGGNASADNYDVVYVGQAPLLEINAKQIKIYLSGGVAPQPFVYGEDYDTVICDAKIEGLLDGQTINVAVIYTAVTSTESARAARAFALRLSASGFIPRNVGTYKAELDWDNCQLVASDSTPIDGGMGNYVLADGFDCQPVTFEIVQKKITVTIDDGSTSVYGDKLPLDKITYSLDVQPADGESLELTFAVLDGENAAKNVGEYPITIAEKAIAGGSIDNYEIVIADTNPVHTITARGINVVLTDQFVTFGDTPAYPEQKGNYDNIDNLADGEELKVFVKYTTRDGQPVENPTAAGNYNIVIDSFEVYDADGKLIENGFKNYEVLSVSGTLEISGRVITIKTGDADKIYDGTALTSDGYVIVSGELPEGYTIGVKTYFEQTNATAEDGVDNKTEFEVLYKGEPTENFVIGCNEYGKFKVTPRPIKIETDSAAKDYDGTALTAGYDILYNGEGDYAALGSGDSFAITQSTSITDKGSIANAIKYIITNAENEDVTSVNYAITYVEGTLTVNALSVEVTLGDVSVQYGEKFDVPVTLDCGVLPNGEQLSFDVIYSNGGVAVTPDTSDSRYFVLAVGTYTMTVDTTTIKVDGEEGKADNYEFVFPATSANLTITQRKIVVTTATDSKTYDGTPLTNTDVDTVVWANDGGTDGLIGGDVLTVDSSVAPASVTDVGDPVKNIVKYIAPANYEIVNTLYGQLSITSRQITVKTDDINDEYDGSAHSSIGFFISVGNLVYGHDLQVETLFERTDATEDGQVKNTTTFKVVDAENNDVTKNYSIGYENGTVIIKRRVLTVQTVDITADYDGKAHSDSSFDWVGEARPVTGHKLDVSQLYTRTDATTDGSQKNTTTFKVVDAAGNDVSKNYNIGYKNGTVTINPAQVSITLADVSTDYGDTDFDGKLTDEASITGCVNGESLNLVFNYSFGEDRMPNVGNYTATLVWDNCTVTGGSALLSNYTLTAQPASASLTVNKKAVTVTVSGTSCTYGDELPLDEISFGLSVPLADGESLKLTYTVTDGNGNVATNVGSYDIKVASKAIEGGNASLDNYNITFAESTPKLTINAKEIVIALKDLTVNYSESLAYPTGAGNYKSLTPDTANGEKIEVIVGYELNGSPVTPAFAGEYDIVLKGIKVYLTDGTTLITDGANNYDYSQFIKGSLKIEGINLVVTRKTVSKIYDGEILSLSQVATDEEISYYYYDAAGNAYTQLGAGYTVELTSSFATRTAGVQSIDNLAEYAVYYKGELSGEFVITYDMTANGKLEITAREIIVITADASKVYDGSPLTKTDGYSTYLDGDRTAAGLLDVDRLTLKSKASLTDVDTVDNATEYYVPNNNYKIVGYEYGKLTVEQREIIIITATDSHVYDGSAYSNTTYRTVLAADGRSQGLVGSDTLTLIGTAPAITNVGSIDNECEYSLPVNAAGGTNYKIANYEYGTLTVTVRRIVVVTATDSKTYDGTPLINAAYVKTYLQGDINSAGLIGEDELTLDASATVPSITNVGVAENACKFLVPNGNYEIAGYDNGNLEITPKALNITLTMDKDSFVYGETAVGKYNTEISGLVDGEQFDVVLIYKLNGVVVAAPKAAGDYTAELDLTLSVCTVNNGTDLENGIGNYAIECNVLEFEITKKDITLEIGAWAAEEYNGKAHAHSGSNSVLEGLEYNEEITSIGLLFYKDAQKTDSVNAPVDAGTYYVFLDGANTLLSTLEALTDNYNVTVVDGYITFTVTKKNLTVSIATDLTQVYNGNEFTLASDCFTANGLVDGEQLELSVEYTSGGAVKQPVNVGTYVITATDAAIVGSPDGIDNYNFSVGNVGEGLIEITRRAINITVATHTVENGNDAYSAQDVQSLAVSGGAGFVGNDLETALENEEIKFVYTPKTPVPDGASSYYTVTLAITEGDVMSNYTVNKITDGTLTITDRWVFVAPVFKGEGDIIYTGEALDSSLFGFLHVHKSESFIADGDEYGFKQEDLDSGKITAVYTFKNLDTNEISTSLPVKAGQYEVTVAITGSSVNDYFIEYAPSGATFTIEKRAIEFTITNNGGNTFVYSGAMPDELNADFTVTAGSFVQNDGDGAVIALYNGEAVSEFANVGSYMLAVKFDNMENYDITIYAASASDKLDIEIVKRTIVVLPQEPEGGREQYYMGYDLRFDEDGFFLYDSDGVTVFDLVEGDVLKITSNSVTPGMLRGNVEIQSVTITNANGEDVTANYDAHYKFLSSDAVLAKLGIKQTVMRIAMSFIQFEVHYEQVIDGATLPYTGVAQTYDISGTAVDEAISVVGDVNLYTGHSFAYSTTGVSVSANAGVYAGWLTGVLKVVDGNGNVVTALYKLVCDNANDTDKPIVVEKNTLKVILNGVTESSLDSGALFTSSPVDGKSVLNTGNYSVEGLLNNGSNVHTVEILVFKIKDRWTLGVVVYRNDNNRRTDMIANYELIDIAHDSGFDVRYITVADIVTLEKPLLEVSINVTAQDIANGYGTLYTPTGIDGCLKLDESLYSYDGLQSGHSIDVYVLRDGNGYKLGVAVYLDMGNGRFADVRSLYNMAEIPAIAGLSAEYIKIDSIKNYMRDVYIDLSNSFIRNSDGTYSANLNGDGTLVHTAVGLSTGDRTEITVTANGNNTFDISVKVLSSSGVDRTEKYYVVNVLASTVPAGVTVNLQ